MKGLSRFTVLLHSEYFKYQGQANTKELINKEYLSLKKNYESFIMVQLSN